MLGEFFSGECRYQATLARPQQEYVVGIHLGQQADVVDYRLEVVHLGKHCHVVGVAVALALAAASAEVKTIGYISLVGNGTGIAFHGLMGERTAVREDDGGCLFARFHLFIYVSVDFLLAFGAIKFGTVELRHGGSGVCHLLFSFSRRQGVVVFIVVGATAYTQRKNYRQQGKRREF